MRCYFPFNTDLYYQCSNELALIKSKHYFQVSKIFCFIARVSLIKGKENTFFRLTVQIQIACSGGIAADSIPRTTQISPSLTSINFFKGQLFASTKDVSCILPYPGDIWRWISNSIAVKSYVTSLNCRGWTMHVEYLWINWKRNVSICLSKR